MFDRFRSIVASFSGLVTHLPTRATAVAALKVSALWAATFLLSILVARTLAARADAEVIVVGTIAIATAVFAYELCRPEVKAVEEHSPCKSGPPGVARLLPEPCVPGWRYPSTDESFHHAISET